MLMWQLLEALWFLLCALEGEPDDLHERGPPDVSR